MSIELEMIERRDALLRLVLSDRMDATDVTRYETILLPPFCQGFAMRIADDGEVLKLCAWGLTETSGVLPTKQTQADEPSLAREAALKWPAPLTNVVGQHNWHESVVCDAQSAKLFRQAMSHLDLDAIKASSSPYGASPDGLGAVCQYHSHEGEGQSFSLCGWVSSTVPSALTAFCKAVYDCAFSQLRELDATKALELVYRRFYPSSLPLKDFSEIDVRIIRIFGALGPEGLLSLERYVLANISKGERLLIDVSNLRTFARMGSEVFGRIARNRTGTIAWWAPNNRELRLEMTGVSLSHIFAARESAMVFLTGQEREHQR
jgi:hypothetical protein